MTKTFVITKRTLSAETHIIVADDAQIALEEVDSGRSPEYSKTITTGTEVDRVWEVCVPDAAHNWVQHGIGLEDYPGQPIVAQMTLLWSRPENPEDMAHRYGYRVEWVEVGNHGSDPDDPEKALDELLTWAAVEGDTLYKITSIDGEA